MNTVDKGRIAEAQVVARLVSQGWEVYLPTFGNGCCDVIACLGTQFIRIETKYVGRVEPSGSYMVALRQVRANRTDTIIRKYNADNSDVLAVYIAPLNVVVFLMSKTLHNRSTINITKHHVNTSQVLAEAVGFEPTGALTRT